MSQAGFERAGELGHDVDRWIAEFLAIFERKLAQAEPQTQV
jgi:hypothetical protein